LDTLFKNLILLSIVTLLVSGAGCLTQVPAQSSGYDDRDTPGAVFTLDSTRHSLENALALPSSAFRPTVALAPVVAKPDVVVRPILVDLREHAIEGPATGITGEVFAQPSPPVQPGFTDDPLQFMTSLDSPFEPRLVFLTWAELLALAFLATRLMRRPLADVTRTACEYRNGRQLTILPEEGLGELRQLVRTFNEMLRRRHQAAEDQSVAIVGLTRYMKFRTARLRTRALGISEWHKRVAFVEDIDSFSTIAQQFLDVVGQSSADQQTAPVDAFLRDRFSFTSVMDKAWFALDLRAGPQFAMPRTLLERLMANLVDNALAHGAPPIEISTSRDPDGWLLSVRDHGAGIKADELSSATRPFVCLHGKEGSDRHWGLGLAIVAKLSRSCGARLSVDNHPDGGLRVQLMLPES
jgi:two-component system osmolarity sensor histidine kinase EnvZ